MRQAFYGRRADYTAQKRNTPKFKEGEFKVSHNSQTWEDFDLLRGHLYGLWQGSYYVSACKVEDGYIAVYKRTRAGNRLYWQKARVRQDCDLAVILMAAQQRNPYPCVTHRPARVDTRGSVPVFPTWEEKRPVYTPRPPVQRPVKTWVDVIIG